MDDLLIEKYAASMTRQLQQAIAAPEQKPVAGRGVGSRVAARPDGASDAGKHFARAVTQLQDLLVEALSAAECKRQSMPHVSLGQVLDQPTAEAYNTAVRAHAGQLAKVRAYLQGAHPPARASIQTLKITCDGCFVLQLEHDRRQDIAMTEAELLAALSKAPACSSEPAVQAAKEHFAAQGGAGSFKVSRFQQIRLALAAMDCEVSGFEAGGQLVLCRLARPAALKDVAEERLAAVWKRCLALWSPLAGALVDFKDVAVLVYVECSLNDSTATVASSPGQPLEGAAPALAAPQDAEPGALPVVAPAAAGPRAGPRLFAAELNGDVLVDVAEYEVRVREQAALTSPPRSPSYLSRTHKAAISIQSAYRRCQARHATQLVEVVATS